MHSRMNLIGRAYAPGKIPSRDWTFEVLDSDDLTYLPIGGLVTHTPSSTKNDTDATDNDAAGWLEHWTMSRSAGLTLEGFMLEDVADGARDAGQERVEVLSTAVGSGSRGGFRVTTPGGTTVTFLASVDVNVFGTEGGGNDDLSPWKATLSMSGQATKA